MAEIVSGITLGELVAWLIGGLGAVISIAKVMEIIETRKKKNAPPCAERLEMLANDKKHLERIDDCLDELRKFNKEQAIINSLMFKFQFAQANHILSGNDVEKIREARDEMQDYLMKKG